MTKDLILFGCGMFCIFGSIAFIVCYFVRTLIDTAKDDAFESSRLETLERKVDNLRYRIDLYASLIDGLQRQSYRNYDINKKE